MFDQLYFRQVPYAVDVTYLLRDKLDVICHVNDTIVNSDWHFGLSSQLPNGYEAPAKAPAKVHF